jgi:hypothetical protein
VHDAGPGQASYTAEFAFENAGDEPVTIESVRTSCGCTAAELEKAVYRPGGDEMASDRQIQFRSATPGKALRTSAGVR